MKKYLALFTAITPLLAVASEAPQPFYVGDMSPLSMNFGAPLATAPAVLDRGQWQWQLGLNLSNTLHIEDRGDEQLLVDAETSRHVLAFDVGISEGIDLRLELPFVGHEAGSLDGFVDDFHDGFGFPEGKRPLVAEDQFAIQYVRDGETLLDISDKQSGLGDVSLSLVQRIPTDYEDHLSYGVRLKFPTGDVDKLTGSDTHDIALWLHAASEIVLDWQHYLSIGGVYMEADEGLLAEIREDAYYFLTYGVQWRANHRVSFKLQANAQTDVYDSETRLLGHSSSLAMGGTLHLPNQFDLDIAVVEDVDVGTSSDVVFHLNLRQRVGW